MGNSDDNRRRIHMDDARKLITGSDPRMSQGADAEQAMRFTIANFVRECYDAGMNPMVMIEMLLAGAAFIGDNSGVSRQQMQKVIGEIALGPDRQLVFAPGARS